MDPLKKLTCSQQLWLRSSVGRALHRYRRGHGSNPAEAWIFFRLLFRNCLNCVSTAKIFRNVISNWAVTDTCFKRNNGMSPMPQTIPSSVSIKICRGRRDRDGRESRTKFYSPNYPDRSSPTVADAVSSVPIWSETIGDGRRPRAADRRRSLQIIWEPGFRGILPKQTIVLIIGKQWEAGYSHVYNFYCSWWSCKLFKNNLYTDCYPCHILKWQFNSNFEKETA